MTSTPASRATGAHSIARRSPTTPFHRRPSSPRAMPVDQGRPEASVSNTDASISGSLARPLFHQLRELPRDNPVLLGAPNRRSGRDVPFFRHGDQNLSPAAQRVGQPSPPHRIEPRERVVQEKDRRLADLPRNRLNPAHSLSRRLRWRSVRS